MNKKFLVPYLVILVLAGGLFIYNATKHSEDKPLNPIVLSSNRNTPLVGGDRDAHNCIGSAGYQWCEAKGKCLRSWEEACDIVAKFNCDKNKNITADFQTLPLDQVSLALSDGRKLVLPHTRSADGARYANKDESVVFWNKGNGAFLEEKGKQTFAGCIAK